nr:uncharacterized protein LOC111415223 [Onthophagus taurus]
MDLNTGSNKEFEDLSLSDHDFCNNNKETVSTVISSVSLLDLEECNSAVDDVPSTCTSTSRKKRYKQIGRKRERDEDSWKQNVNKLLRNSGQAYTTRKGKSISAKQFKQNYDCKCPAKCKDKVTEE